MRIGDTGDGAALAQQQPLSRGVDDHVRHQPGKVHIVGPDSQQYEIEAAVRLLPVQGGHQIAQLAELSRRRARAALDPDHPGTIVGALSSK